MSQPLRADLLATGHFAVRAMSIALTGTAVAIAFLPRQAAHVAPAAPALELATTTTLPVRVTRQEPPPPPAPPPRGGHFAFVFRAAGTTYMKLADLDAASLPRHRRLHVVVDDYTTSALGAVRAQDVPAAYAGWLGRAVVVDGRCTAHVTGFAVIARLTGDPGYAGETATTWTASSILDHGNIVLAAKLESPGCAGARSNAKRCGGSIDVCDGSYARDAALPPIVVPVAVQAPELAMRAKAALLASKAAAETQRAWREDFGQKGRWIDSDSVTITTDVLRHPTTGVTFVSVLAHRDHGCGDAEVNVWGLFRVERDGSLHTVQLRELGELDTIDQLLDVDGDGTLEVLGKPWLGLDRVLEHPDGTALDQLSLPFFGCPC